jgi:hypothetical protein
MALAELVLDAAEPIAEVGDASGQLDVAVTLLRLQQVLVMSQVVNGTAHDIHKHLQVCLGHGPSTQSVADLLAHKHQLVT